MALYLLLGVLQRAWNFSMSRLLAGIGVSLAVIALAGAVGRSTISAGQTLLWGGNIAYIGALLGWLVADSFRG